MNEYRHLQKKQFGVYKSPSQISTKDQSTRVGKWLASDKGHAWQDSLARIEHQGFREENNKSFGFFSTRNPGIFGGAGGEGNAYTENNALESRSGTVMKVSDEALDERILS